jgi:FHS family glucose/mannose:H+ symporter-like MFS transporter
MYKQNKVFAAACIALLLFGIIFITLGSILPVLTAKFAMNGLSAGKLVSLLPIGILVGSLTFGPIVDRYGYKVLLIASVLLSVIAMEGLIFTNSFFILQICILSIGVAGGILNGGGNALVADITKEDKGANLSLLGVFFGIGALGMPLLLGILSKHFRYPSIISGIGLFMLIGAVYLFLIPFPKPKQEQGFPLKAGIKLLKEPALLLTSFFLFFESGVEGLINNWTTTFLQTQLNVPPEKALYALSFTIIGLTITRLLLGALLKKIDSLLVLFVSLLLIAAGNLMLLYTASYSMAFTALIIIGTGLAAGFPVILGYIGQLYANLSGTAFSIALVIALTGNTLLNYLFGIIANKYSISSLPVLLLGCIICMLILLMMIKQKIIVKTKSEIKFTSN